jgi:hypothetical protein
VCGNKGSERRAERKWDGDARVAGGHRGAGPRAQQPVVEPQADDEQEEQRAELRDRRQRRQRYWREGRGPQVGGGRAEQRGPEGEPRDHLADHARLPDATGQPPAGARGGEHDDELQKEARKVEHAGGRGRGGSIQCTPAARPARRAGVTRGTRPPSLYSAAPGR